MLRIMAAQELGFPICEFVIEWYEGVWGHLLGFGVVIEHNQKFVLARPASLGQHFCNDLMSCVRVVAMREVYNVRLMGI